MIHRMGNGNSLSHCGLVVCLYLEGATFHEDMESGMVFVLLGGAYFANTHNLGEVNETTGWLEKG